MAVIIGLIVLNSCEKQEVVISESKPENSIELPFAVSNDNGVLNFETKEDYELALNYLVNLEIKGELNQFESQTGFESYRLRFKDNNEKMNEIQDDILATFLNPDKKVVIEKHLFEINLVDNKVSVWDYQGCDLKSANTDLYVGEFHCDDDVFGILEGKLINKSVNATTCPESKFGVLERVEMVDQDQFLTYYDYYVQYIKGGIYYTLNSRIRCQLTKTVLKISCNGGTYRRINKDENQDIEAHEESGKDWERNYRAYWGLNRLEEYNFPVAFSASTTTTIAKNGIGVGETEIIFSEAVVVGICEDN